MYTYSYRERKREKQVNAYPDIEWGFKELDKEQQSELIDL